MQRAGTTRVFSFILLAFAGCSGRQHAQSTLAGVFTAEQAARGKDIYSGMCASCHIGLGNHTGPVFRTRWGGTNLGEMFGYISNNMPKNDPGTLAPDEYVAVMAYLLELNGMPAGSKPLPVDSVALKAIIYDTAATTP